MNGLNRRGWLRHRELQIIRALLRGRSWRSRYREKKMHRKLIISGNGLKNKKCWKRRRDCSKCLNKGILCKFESEMTLRRRLMHRLISQHGAANIIMRVWDSGQSVHVLKLPYNSK